MFPKPNHFARKNWFFPRLGLGAAFAGGAEGDFTGCLATRDKMSVKKALGIKWKIDRLESIANEKVKNSYDIL